MKITKELLREKGACAAGYRDFLKEFPKEKYPDGVEYQDLLDCCAEKGFSYGSWLLSVFGRTDDVRKVDGDLITEKSIIFAGRLEVSGSIEAGEGIEAGCKFGIYAGLRVRITSEYRKIIAKTKPENIMCGEFVEAENE
nr:MAG TPA: hypothetical protein [Caudoviricetes sp.]